MRIIDGCKGCKYRSDPSINHFINWCSHPVFKTPVVVLKKGECIGKEKKDNGAKRILEREPGTE
jgi:hypothetical protein